MGAGVEVWCRDGGLRLAGVGEEEGFEVVSMLVPTEMVVDCLGLRTRSKDEE